MTMKSGPLKTRVQNGGVDEPPYSESNFKTLKYCPAFPRNFGSIEDARSFCAAFFEYYNHRHRHPASVYTHLHQSTTAPLTRFERNAPACSTRSTPRTPPGSADDPAHSSCPPSHVTHHAKHSSRTNNPKLSQSL